MNRPANGRASGSRKRADDARKLAIETALAAGLESPLITAESDPRAMPSRQLSTDAAGHPKSQAQRNFTDPDSHILKGSDGDHQVIVAIGVSNQPSDVVHLLPMVERIEANIGQLPDALIADAGYCSTANLEACGRKGLETSISTSRQQHDQRPRPSRRRAPRGPRWPRTNGTKAQIQGWPSDLRHAKTVVEPVFGQIKGARSLDRFRLRGLEKVNGEWALMATTHNIL